MNTEYFHNNRVSLRSKRFQYTHCAETFATQATTEWEVQETFYFFLFEY